MHSVVGKLVVDTGWGWLGFGLFGLGYTYNRLETW